MEPHPEDWVYQIKSDDAGPDEIPEWQASIRLVLEIVKDIVVKAWLYVILGIALGAGIHGYVPAPLSPKLNELPPTLPGV